MKKANNQENKQTKNSRLKIAVIQRTAALPKALKTVNNFYSSDDPFGSYTGICADKRERPVQDADDL